MMTVASIVLMLCAVVIQITLASACCTPDQWEGFQVSNGGYADWKRKGLIREFVKVHYDGTNGRTAAFLDYHNGDYSNKFRLVTRYDDGTDEEGKLYVVDLKKDKCWTKTLKQPFRKACIPDEAKSVGDYYMGLEGGFKVTGYEGEKWGIHAYIAVEKLDDDQCVPVSESLNGKLKHVSFVQSVGFADITPGIRNASVFDVPEACDDTEDFSFAPELTREHYFLAI